MARERAFGGLAAAVLAAVACRGTMALDIVKDGKPAATVVLPENADIIAKESARLIVENIRLCTGATLPTAPESKAPADGTLISIGKTVAADKLNLDVDKQLADTCFLRVQDRTLFLLGRDEDVRYVANMEGAEGTLNAAFAFLRDYAGVRWIMPTDQGVWTPKASDISVPDDLNRKIEPTLLYIHPRLGNYYPWSRANGARTAIKIRGGGETWGQAVPSAKYAADHPEYFAMRDGKRLADPKNGDPSLCTSNPAVVDLLTKYVQSKFDEGNDVVELGECDAYRGRSCQCPECTKRFGEAWTDQTKYIKGTALRVYLPHMEVLQRCLKSHPNKFVMLMVYSLQGQYLGRVASGREPNPGIQFPANTVANICGPSEHGIRVMKRIIPRVTAYTYCWCEYFSGFSPQQSPTTVSTFMHMLVDEKSLGAYFDGGADNWAGEGPTLYVGMRSGQDPVPEADDLMKEFCAGLYGKAADTMMQYYKLLYGRVRTMVDALFCYLEIVFPDTPNDHLLGEKYVTFWPEANLKKMETLLDKAKTEAARDPRALNWLRLARIGFDQVNTTAEVYYAERAYEAHKSAPALGIIKTRMDAYKKFVQSINDLPTADAQFVKDYFPNYRAFAEDLNKNEGCHCGRGVPFTWDIDKLLAEGKLP